MAFGSRSSSIRSLFQWQPWQELEELWRALEQASNRSVGPAGPEAAVVTFIPEVDLYDVGSSIVIKVDLPGVPRENIDISTEEDTLTVSGHRDPDRLEDAGCLTCERPLGRFARRIELAKNVDVPQATATLRNGVLEITVPKTAKTTIGKVAIKIGD